MRGYRRSVVVLSVLLLVLAGILVFRGLVTSGEVPMGEEQEIVGLNASGVSVSGAAEGADRDAETAGRGFDTGRESGAGEDGNKAQEASRTGEEGQEFSQTGEEGQEFSQTDDTERNGIKSEKTERESSGKEETGQGSSERKDTARENSKKKNTQPDSSGKKDAGTGSKKKKSTGQNSSGKGDTGQENKKTDKGQAPTQKQTAGKERNEVSPAGKSMSDPDGKKDSKGQAPSAESAKIPEKTQAPDRQIVSIRIECTAILSQRERWKSGLEEVVPENGIFYEGTYPWNNGLTVYDVLKAVCSEADIALDSQFTPMFHTYYIRGIGNLYEFDCGGESGWKYKVNDVVPGVGCSAYGLKAGDQIIFFYDCEI